MSRVGNNPILIPEGTIVSINDNIVSVKGKLGELSQAIHKSIAVNIEDSQVTLTRESEDKQIKS